MALATSEDAQLAMALATYDAAHLALASFEDAQLAMALALS